MTSQSLVWQFDGQIVGVVDDVFAEFFEHLNDGADLSGGWCSHNQMWMP
jgi:hypothetical protein